MKTTFAVLIERWEGFWFRPDTRRNFEAVRIVVAVHALWILLSRDFGAISGLVDLWTEVPLTRMVRYGLFPNHPVLETTLQGIAVAALVCAIIGVWTRTACLLSGILIYHLAPLETVFWAATPYARGLTITPIALLLLSVAPSGGRLVLWKGRHETDVMEPSWDYGWPIRTIQFLVAGLFLFSAWGKMTEAGWAWSSAENISHTLIKFNIDPAQGRFHGVGLWLAEHPLLCLMIGVGTVIFEWIFIVALFNRPSRWVLIPVALAFHVGIMISMNVHVGETWLVLVYVNWEVVLHRMSGFLSSGPSANKADALA